MRNEWNGDVDTGTGELQEMYSKYLDRIKRLQPSITVSAKDALSVLLREQIDLTDDLKFVSHGMCCVKVMI